MNWAAAKHIIDKVADFIFPRHCLCCGKTNPRRRIRLYLRRMQGNVETADGRKMHEMFGTNRTRDAAECQRMRKVYRQKIRIRQKSLPVRIRRRGARNCPRAKIQNGRVCPRRHLENRGKNSGDGNIFQGRNSRSRAAPHNTHNEAALQPKRANRKSGCKKTSRRERKNRKTSTQNAADFHANILRQTGTRGKHKGRVCRDKESRRNFERGEYCNRRRRYDERRNAFGMRKDPQTRGIQTRFGVCICAQIINRQSAIVLRGTFRGDKNPFHREKNQAILRRTKMGDVNSAADKTSTKHPHKKSGNDYFGNIAHIKRMPYPPLKEQNKKNTPRRAKPRKTQKNRRICHFTPSGNARYTRRHKTAN